jgi:hypothetical protein
MVEQWRIEPLDFAVFDAGTKRNSWRRASARQYSKQDPLNRRAKALRHETQSLEQSIVVSFSEQLLMSLGRTR